ncbi:hypothetical protein ACLOJK_028057 [Asimina triloba]
MLAISTSFHPAPSSSRLSLDLPPHPHPVARRLWFVSPSSSLSPASLSLRLAARISLSGVASCRASLLSTDVIHGELRVDMVNGGTDLNNHDSTNGNLTTHAHTANHVVSPKKLSSRLHEVIQSRLEERILELKAAFQDNQKCLRLVETWWMNSQLGLSNRLLDM